MREKKKNSTLKSNTVIFFPCQDVTSDTKKYLIKCNSSALTLNPSNKCTSIYYSHYSLSDGIVLHPHKTEHLSLFNRVPSSDQT